MSTQILSPAKLNLFLAITGRRPDGFHDLVSVTAQLDWGDTLELRASNGDWSFSTDAPDLAMDEGNLVVRAVRLFAATNPSAQPCHVHLVKRIPMGAGLGGGSSNAATILRELNARSEQRLPSAELARLAAELGSDCPLFLGSAPVIMRGRGEQITPLSASTQRRICGRKVLLFRPPFAISTGWAYRRLAAAGGLVTPGGAEARLAAWLSDEAVPVEDLLFNSMEAAVWQKFPTMPLTFSRLEKLGLRPRMSGSGSVCFSFLPERIALTEVNQRLTDVWGDAMWYRIAQTI